MARWPIPPDDLPLTTWRSRLGDVAGCDLPSVRRETLLRLIWQQSYQTRQGLIAGVEMLWGRGYFGTDWQAEFRRDMRAVRQALADAGYRLVYDRRQRAYFIEGRPPLDEKLRQIIAGAAAEVDPRQIAIYKRLTPAQRIWQLGHLSDWLRRANERRLARRRAVEQSQGT